MLIAVPAVARADVVATYALMLALVTAVDTGVIVGLAAAAIGKKLGAIVSATSRNPDR